MQAIKFWINNEQIISKKYHTECICFNSDHLFDFDCCWYLLPMDLSEANGGLPYDLSLPDNTEYMRRRHYMYKLRLAKHPVDSSTIHSEFARCAQGKH